MWILLAFLAVFLWSLVNIADNFLVERNKKLGHPIGALVIFSSFFGFIVAIVIALFIHTPLAVSSKNLIFLILAGICNLSWIIFYLKALPDEDVSSVIPWFLTSPIFAYILGYYVLGEKLGIHQLIGGAVTLLGGLLLSIKKGEDGYGMRWKLVINMTIASFLIALWGVLFKFVAEDAGFWVSSFWEYLGLGLAGILVVIFVPSYRRGFSTIIKEDGKLVLTVSIFAETATVIGNLIANYAILLVPVAMVYLLEVAQPAVVFILGLICTAFFPNILTEDVSRKNILQKTISIAIMIIGGLLLIK